MQFFSGLANGSMLHELFQREAVCRQGAFQHFHGFAGREPIGFEGGRPLQFGPVRIERADRHAGPTVAEGRVGQQEVTQLTRVFIPRFETFDDRATIGAGQRAQRADSLPRQRAGDDPGEIAMRRAEITDYLPDGVSRCVDRDLACKLSHGLAALLI